MILVVLRYSIQMIVKVDISQNQYKYNPEFISLPLLPQKQ